MSANKPVYPCYSLETESHELGLTKREYFAAMAMQSLIPIYEENPNFDLCLKAKSLADAMIKELQVQS